MEISRSLRGPEPETLRLSHPTEPKTIEFFPLLSISFKFFQVLSLLSTSFKFFPFFLHIQCVAYRPRALTGATLRVVE
jgi:hypothetical protein